MSILEDIASLREAWLLGIGVYPLLGIAVEKPINRSRGRHRLSPLLGERLLDGSGTTVFARLDERLAQGHDAVGDALGRWGRGSAGASASCCAPGGSGGQRALPPLVEPACRAGPLPAEVLDGIACQVAVVGSLSRWFVRLRPGGLLWSLSPYISDCSLFSMSWHSYPGCDDMSRCLGVVSACG